MCVRRCACALRCRSKRVGLGDLEWVGGPAAEQLIVDTIRQSKRDAEKYARMSPDEQKAENQRSLALLLFLARTGARVPEVLNCHKTAGLEIELLARTYFRGLCAPSEGLGWPGLAVRDLYAAFVSERGRLNRLISAVRIRNTIHKNSKPRIHMLSR